MAQPRLKKLHAVPKADGEAKIDSQQQSVLFNMPNECVTKIVTPRYLAPRAIANMAQTCRLAFAMFQSGLRRKKMLGHLQKEEYVQADMAAQADPALALIKFQHHVAFGQQVQAAHHLTQCPEFVFRGGVVKDYSHRRFSHVFAAAIRYAAWARDTRMLKMFLEKLPPDRHNEFGAQLLDHEKFGTEHGVHFDLLPFFNLLQHYIDNAHRWSWRERKTYWRETIGQAMRSLPANIAQEFCDPHPRFIPLRNFSSKTMARQLDIVDGIRLGKTSAVSKWFPLQPNKGLGFDGAAVMSRPMFPEAPAYIAPCMMIEDCPVELARATLRDLMLLDYIRKSEYQKLLTSFTFGVSHDRDESEEVELQSSSSRYVLPASSVKPRW